MTTKNKNLTKLAIMCLALTDVGVGATTPALATIGAAWPDVPFSLIQLIASIPAIFVGLIPALLYAPLVKVMKKRSIMWVGIILFLIGGIGPAFIHPNIYVILFLRILLGISTGLLTPMGLDLIYDFFEGHEQRTMLGWSSAAMGASGILFQILGGFLSAIRWDYTFYAYFVSVIFFIISVAFLPEPAKKVQQQAADIPKEKLPGAAWFYVAVTFLNGVFFFVAITNSAYVLVGEGMAQPAQIGLMFSVLTAASVVIGLLFSQLFKLMKHYILAGTFLCGAIGLFLCYSTHSITVFTVGLFLNGLCLGGSTSAVWAKFGELIPAIKIPLAISLGVSAINLGEFFQPIIFNLFTVPGRAPFMYGWIGFAALFVIAIILERSIPTKANEVSKSNVSA